MGAVLNNPVWLQSKDYSYLIHADSDALQGVVVEVVVMMISKIDSATREKSGCGQEGLFPLLRK